jgi:excisionase family DNA binding protein
MTSHNPTPPPSHSPEADEPLLVSLDEAARLLSICRATVYKLIAANRLTRRHIGRRAFLLRTEVATFAKSLASKSGL